MNFGQSNSGLPEGKVRQYLYGLPIHGGLTKSGKEMFLWRQVIYHCVAQNILLHHYACSTKEAFLKDVLVILKQIQDDRNIFCFETLTVASR